MKKVEAIIRQSKVANTASALEKIGVGSMRCTEIKMWGNLTSGDQKEFLPKILLTIITPEDKTKQVVGTIIETAQTGMEGDGEILVYPIDEAIKIKDGERFDELSVELDIAVAATMAAAAAIEAGQHKQGLGVG